MPRYLRFTFLATSDERRSLAALARRLERSQSDTVRLLIRKAARELPLDDPRPATGQERPAVEQGESPA